MVVVPWLAERVWQVVAGADGLERCESAGPLGEEEREGGARGVRPPHTVPNQTLWLLIFFAVWLAAVGWEGLDGMGWQAGAECGVAEAS